MLYNNAVFVTHSTGGYVGKSDTAAKLVKLKRRLEKHPSVHDVRFTDWSETDQPDDVHVLGRHKGCLLVRVCFRGRSGIMRVTTVMGKKPFRNILDPVLRDLSLRFNT